MVGRTPAGQPWHLDASGAKRSLFVEGPSIRLDRRSPSAAPVAVDKPVSVQANIFASLDDPIFDPSMGEKGVYDPSSFLMRTQGLVFGLEPFDPSKTIVLFVHGILGTPRDFKYLVDGLDRSRYQPWFFYYPSGFPLDKAGALLATVMEYVSKVQDGKSRIILVAHSMGGIVSRRALNDVCEKGHPAWLKGYVSFCTPYGGTDSAKAGTKAPEAVASWKDVATGSDFVGRIHAQPLPADLPFHLFFGWGKEGENGETGPKPAGDGTIELRSQLDPRAQKAAWRLYGYEETHVGILQYEASRKQFLAVLDGLDGGKRP